MMKLWKKDSPKRLNPGQERWAYQAAARIRQAQRRLADRLNRQTEHLSGRKWLFLLIGFCAAFGGYCLFLLLQIAN